MEEYDLLTCKYYAGIGSRKTPEDVLLLMERLAQKLSHRYILRSGGADGADTAFEKGARLPQGEAEVYLPWQGFNKSNSPLHQVDAQALTLASTLHPGWSELGQGPRKLHARNCYQVLGQNLATPVEFVVCWTSDGCESTRQRRKSTGGTATAIVLAERLNIPRFNLFNMKSRQQLFERLKNEGIEVLELLPSGLQNSLF